MKFTDSYSNIYSLNKWISLFHKWVKIWYKYSFVMSIKINCLLSYLFFLWYSKCISYFKICDNLINSHQMTLLIMNLSFLYSESKCHLTIVLIHCKDIYVWINHKIQSHHKICFLRWIQFHLIHYLSTFNLLIALIF